MSKHHAPNQLTWVVLALAVLFTCCIAMLPVGCAYTIAHVPLFARDEGPDDGGTCPCGKPVVHPHALCADCITAQADDEVEDAGY